MLNNMKIIGHTTGGFIIEASDEEVRSLLAAGDDRRKDLSKLRTGTELSFTVALQNLAAVKDAKLSKELAYLKGHLRDSITYGQSMLNAVEKLEVPIVTLEKDTQAKSI